MCLSIFFNYFRIKAWSIIIIYFNDSVLYLSIYCNSRIYRYISTFRMSTYSNILIFIFICNFF